MNITNINIFLKYILSIYGFFIRGINVSNNALIEIEVHSSDVNTLLFLLKNDEFFCYNKFVDLVSYDHIDVTGDRFTLNYIVGSDLNFFNLNISTTLKEGTFMESITNCYDCANWSERELFDMFGIYFSNNDKLCRILSDYGFKGHPLRKDFPMSGYIDAYYNIEQGKIGHYPIELMQAFRKFTLTNATVAQSVSAVGADLTEESFSNVTDL